MLWGGWRFDLRQQRPPPVQLGVGSRPGIRDNGPWSHTMSPQRIAAIRYLTQQLRTYREELTAWMKAGAFLRLGTLQGGITAQLRSLIDDSATLLGRLKGKPQPGMDRGCEDDQAA
jgi:hypothetical protein